MKKNKMMRTASGLLVATLLTTSIISGTFAKYVTTASGEDSARVAKWGFEGGDTITLDNLFKDAYDGTVDSENDKDVIAPGTKGEATFGFTYGGDTKATAPEVAYTFNISTEGSDCAEAIQNNKDIVWSLDGTEVGSWTELLTAIEALDGNKTGDRYEANTLPTAFNNTNTTYGDADKNLHKVSWEWKFEGDSTYDANKSQDQYDADMGNKTNLDDVTLKISVTATQID